MKLKSQVISSNLLQEERQIYGNNYTQKIVLDKGEHEQHSTKHFTA